MNKKVIENLQVIDIADEGRAVAKHEQMVVFIDAAVPGDVADVEIYKQKKSYAEGRIIKLVKPSEHRTEPFCSHFGVCGGCKWQYMDYKMQLHYKQKQVSEAMKRIAKIENPVLSPIIGSVNETFYRNKLEFTFSNKRWLTVDDMKKGVNDLEPALGYHIPGRYDKVLPIEKCYLQDDLSNQIRNFVFQYCMKNNFTFFDLKKQEGMMRNMIIRNTTLGEWMVIMIFKEDDKGKRESLLNALKENFPQITSLMYNINQKRNDSIYDLDFTLHSGKPFITEQMEDLKFRIGPKSFFQTNSIQALELYKVARDYAQLTGEEIVYDLYTGTGTIANFVARNASKVVGVEYVAEAIEDAKINSQENNISNTSFYAGDMKDMLTTSFYETNGYPDVIITDPPRAGMHEKVVAMLNQSNAKRIVYVSCNAATQARDLALMAEKYVVTKIQPVDMFPHTHHVENVVLLELK
ncbi:MAG: 23S rRNA (uracil(1939)-C(5))-methyltransferase RlmD [Bacteroidia bacterium]